jgi:hypothetical protein
MWLNQRTHLKMLISVLLYADVLPAKNMWVYLPKKYFTIVKHAFILRPLERVSKSNNTCI